MDLSDSEDLSRDAPNVFHYRCFEADTMGISSKSTIRYSLVTIRPLFKGIFALF